jgi:hypothetical protein
VVSRDEVLKKVWDDNGLTSSNSNLNQYLSMLRKTFRHYDIDNIIVTVSRGMLQLNQDLSIELLDAGPALADVASPAAPPGEPAGAGRETTPPAASRADLLVSGRRLPAGHRPASGGGIHVCRNPRRPANQSDADEPQPVRTAGQR